MEKCLEDSPECSLFVHSLIFGRLEMSEMFWERMQSKTAAALQAFCITKSMLRSFPATIDMTLQDSISKIQKHYEERAVGILTACYRHNIKNSHDLLKVEHEHWYNRSCLTLAQRADCKAFISQSGCQSLIREKWLGDISERNPKWQIFLAAIIPFLVWFIIWFESDTVHEKNKTTRKVDVKIVRRKCLSLLDGWQKFYSTAIVTYTLYVTSNVLLLLLFSYVVLAG